MPGWRARDDARIVAATDASATRREAFLAACPQGRWHETIDDLLSGEELDFVDICAPPGSHAALIERALGAGLHVLSEKPLVTRVEDAKRVAAAAARARRVVHTVHNWLQAPISRKISALIDEGAIGARPICPLADAENATSDRGERGRGHELARRSGTSGRRRLVRSRLARALLRHALGRRAGRGNRDASKRAASMSSRWKTQRALT